MKAWEWLAATSAEWRPSLRPGSLDIGPLVIYSRRALSQEWWDAFDLGARTASELGKESPPPPLQLV